MITIGITGGIGSGKSYVSDILRKEFGIPVYDCDKEAKRLTVTDKEIRKELTLLVGQEVFKGMALNKKILSDFLFANSEHARQVNAIIHPAVLKDFKRWAEKQASKLVALESAILYESGFNECVDKVLFVEAPEEVRLYRAMQRDTSTEEQVRARMKMQQSERYRFHADYIVDNSTNNSISLLEQLNKIVHCNI